MKLNSIEEAKAFWESLEGDTKVYLADTAPQIIGPWHDREESYYPDYDELLKAQSFRFSYDDHMNIDINQQEDGRWLAECTWTFMEDEEREKYKRTCNSREEGKQFLDDLLVGLGYVLKDY